MECLDLFYSLRKNVYSRSVIYVFIFEKTALFRFNKKNLYTLFFLIQNKLFLFAYISRAFTGAGNRVFKFKSEYEVLAIEFHKSQYGI